MSTNPNAIQVGGSHYRTSSGVQHWDVMDEYRVGYLEAAATKYLLRWRKKDGVKDLQKAEHFLRKLYACRGEMPFVDQIARMPVVPSAVIDQLCADNMTPPGETRLIQLILNWNTTATIELVRRGVQGLIDDQRDGSEPGPGYVNQD